MEVVLPGIMIILCDILADSPEQNRTASSIQVGRIRAMQDLHFAIGFQ
ncbi:MAG TPA: hypothetical protein PLI05_10590 [Methanotrichaceae archaeon]|nr:hypothetical protein [Methanotrichaceae archaeon]HQF17500.1 hypothetical protein [Methanotrichaceae archaeon]HQI92095.1 hypothetical protein [Methanotrichaceae archaeon]HQJ29334.1 hypothetical protein [Methanotrichaceae archaeon]